MEGGKKKCELCCGVARLYCESDEASLCWDCDGNVHGANFLVAKHTRCLLCSLCHSHTPWKASGFRLGPIVSICESCLARKKKSGRNQNLNQQEIVIGCDGGGDRLIRDDDGAESYDEVSDEDEDEKEEGEAENQVVPEAATGGQELPVVSTGDGDQVVKRTRRDLDLNCSHEENESRPLKRVLKDEASSRSNGCDELSSRREEIKRL